MGQDGTQIGGLYGVAQHHGRVETNVGTLYDTGLAATPGQDFYVSTGYYSGAYHYFLYNYYTGQSVSPVGTPSSFGGSTAESIAERPGSANLANFSTMQFVDVTVAAQAYPLGNYPYIEAVLQNASYTYNLATNSALRNGDAFSVSQNHCA